MRRGDKIVVTHVDNINAAFEASGMMEKVKQHTPFAAVGDTGHIFGFDHFGTVVSFDPGSVAYESIKHVIETLNQTVTPQQYIFSLWIDDFDLVDQPAGPADFSVHGSLDPLNR